MPVYLAFLQDWYCWASGCVTPAGGASSNGYAVAAQTLAALGIRHMYGVIGIPVTELASAAQVGHATDWGLSVAGRCICMSAI